MEPRYDISNKMVQDLLDSGIPQEEIARRLNCSTMLVYSVRDGVRKDPVIPKRYQGNGVKKCRCCKLRPIKKGNRFLCGYCYRNGSTGDLYYDAVSHVEVDCPSQLF